jgi:twitching motility protein PilT
LTDEQVRAFIASIAPPRFRSSIDDKIIAGLDFSYAAPGVSRFRCSAYQNLNQAGMAMRVIRDRIPSIAELHLPPVVSEIAVSHRGLTLVTGTTGSGKSTTLAAIIDLINTHHASKIITIEDPVEYMHVPKQLSSRSWKSAPTRRASSRRCGRVLRQDPDVVLVGELRDMDTLRIALRAADTGHQVFRPSTRQRAADDRAHHRDVPAVEHKLLLTQLAGNLEAIISQRW